MARKPQEILGLFEETPTRKAQRIKGAVRIKGKEEQVFTLGPGGAPIKTSQELLTKGFREEEVEVVTPEEARTLGIAEQFMPKPPKPAPIIKPTAPIEPTPPAVTGAEEEVEVGIPVFRGGNIEAEIQSVTQNAEKYRTNLESVLEQERTRIAREKEEAQQRIQEIEKKEELALEQVKDLTAPWREELEKKGREEFFITENFRKSQALISELDTLLTGIQAKVEEERAKTGLESVRTPQIARTIDEATGRVSIIESVLAARSQAIQTGFTLLDRRMDAITRDRRDRLDYYNGLLKFYDTARDERQKKLFTLSKEDRAFLDSELSLLQNDMARSQEAVNYIKQLALDPESAQFIADAGVNPATDSIERINEKMAEHGYNLEVRELHDRMEAEGYSHIPLPKFLSGIPPEEIATRVDSRNVEHKYRKPPTKLTEERIGNFIVLRDSEGKVISTRSATTGRETGLDFTTSDAVQQLLQSGFSRADAKSLLDSQTKLTGGSQDALLDQVYGKELPASVSGQKLELMKAIATTNPDEISLDEAKDIIRQAGFSPDDEEIKDALDATYGGRVGRFLGGIKEFFSF